MQKEFIFLYPISPIIDFEIKNYSWSRGGEETFGKKYKSVMNKCINERYRDKGFEINFVIFKDCSVSDVFDVRSKDRIIKVEIDFETHKNQKVYPNPDYVLDLFEGTEEIVISGFHLWDCVERLAKRSYKRGFKTLVDEDLTELFSVRMDYSNFRTDEYPTYNPRELSPRLSKLFEKTRKERPWLWQEYPSQG